MERVEVEITPKTAHHLAVIKMAITKGPMSDAEALTRAAQILAAFLDARRREQTSEPRLALDTVALMLGFQYDLPTKE